MYLSIYLSVYRIYWIYQSDLSMGSINLIYLSDLSIGPIYQSVYIDGWIHGTRMNYVYTHIIYRVYEYILFTLLAVQLSY